MVDINIRLGLTHYDKKRGYYVPSEGYLRNYLIESTKGKLKSICKQLGLPISRICKIGNKQDSYAHYGIKYYGTYFVYSMDINNV